MEFWVLKLLLWICQGDLSAKDLSSDVQFVLAEKLFLCFVILWFEVCTTQFLILWRKKRQWNSWCNRRSNNNSWELCSQTGSCFAMPHKRKSKIVNNYCKMQLPEKFTLRLVVRAVIRIKLALQSLTIIWWSYIQLLDIMCCIINNYYVPSKLSSLPNNYFSDLKEVSAIHVTQNMIKLNYSCLLINL